MEADTTGEWQASRSTWLDDWPSVAGTAAVGALTMWWRSGWPVAAGRCCLRSACSPPWAATGGLSCNMATVDINIACAENCCNTYYMATVDINIACAENCCNTYYMATVDINIACAENCCNTYYMATVDINIACAENCCNTYYMATVDINIACAENCCNTYYMATVPHELRSLNRPTTCPALCASRIHPSDHRHTQSHF